MTKRKDTRVRITFDKSLIGEMHEIFFQKEKNRSCQFCKEELTKESTGGWDYDGGLCNNFDCVFSFVEKERDVVK